MLEESNPYSAPKADIGLVEASPSRRIGWKAYAYGMAVIQIVGFFLDLKKIYPEQGGADVVDSGPPGRMRSPRRALSDPFSRCIFATGSLLMPGVPAKSDPKDKIASQLQLDIPTGKHPTGKSEVETPFFRPFLKWAGGKTQLLPQLARFYPPRGSVRRYIEPFLGSGAVFFHFKAMVEPRQVVLWDNNRELIETFQAVRDDVGQVIKLLRKHQKAHDKDFFL